MENRMEPISIDAETILARLTERMPQFLTDPRVGQLLIEVTMRDVALEQLRARVDELEKQLSATNGQKDVKVPETVEVS